MSQGAGFSKVNHPVMHAAIRANFSGRQSAVFWSIERETTGYQRDFNKIKTSTLIAMTRIDKTNVGKIKNELIKRKILIVTKNGIGINKNTSEWLQKDMKPIVEIDYKATRSASRNSYEEVETDYSDGQNQPEKVVKNDYSDSQNQLEKVVKNDYSLIKERKEKKNKDLNLINSTNSKIQTLENFEITDELKTWAEENGISQIVNLKASTKKFIEWHQDNQGKWKNLNVAWLGWMESAKKNALEPQKKPTRTAKQARVEPPIGTYAKSSTVDKIKADFAHLVEKEKQAEQHQTAFH